MNGWEVFSSESLLKRAQMTLDLFKDIFFTLYNGKLPLNHHLILSKPKWHRFGRSSFVTFWWWVLTEVVRLLATYNGREHVYFLLEARVRESGGGNIGDRNDWRWEGPTWSARCWFFGLQKHTQIRSFFFDSYTSQMSDSEDQIFECILLIWQIPKPLR